MMKKTDKSSVDISIVIPAYNEETNIRLGTLDKVLLYLSKQKFSWEVVLVDDGSDDATPKLLDQFARANPGFRVIHNPHQGKAATVMTGMLSALGGVILFTDLDQATPLSELENLLPFFSEGYDIVIGSRNTNRQGAPFLRVVMARGFMMLRSVILGLKGITDTQCGFKAFRKEVSQKVFSKLRLYGNMHSVSGSMVSAGFDIEVLYLARRMGFKIKEVPVDWHYVETRRVNPVKDSWQGFIDIINIKMNDMKGKYL
jgi:dolichyl-phosphate beta-glucosyltransferase